MHCQSAWHASGHPAIRPECHICCVRRSCTRAVKRQLVRSQQFSAWLVPCATLRQHAVPRVLRHHRAIETSATAQLTGQRPSKQHSPTTDSHTVSLLPASDVPFANLALWHIAHDLIHRLVYAQDAAEDDIEAESRAALDWPAICAQVRCRCTL